MTPTRIQPDSDTPEAVEIELLLEAVFRRYGYDFREYASASLKRRIANVVEAEGVA